MTDTPAKMTYGDYLGLDTLLSSQHPISDLHDELLFVIIHQTKELWLKQIIHELKLAKALIRSDQLIQVHKNLSRVSRIQAVMTMSWDVLATMTPTDYTSFRDVLGSSSGFQSAQFRQMEFMLGLKDARHIRFQDEGTEWHRALVRALDEPSLWDEANRALARKGFDLPADVLEREWREPYRQDQRIESAWLQVYRNPKHWWSLYQLAEKLVDIDESLTTWRHKHAVTVERIIGSKMGTGGSPGVAYLRSTTSKRAFPELWTLRTGL